MNYEQLVKEFFPKAFCFRYAVGLVTYDIYSDETSLNCISIGNTDEDSAWKEAFEIIKYTVKLSIDDIMNVLK